jgi:hypothetical protein
MPLQTFANWFKKQAQKPAAKPVPPVLSGAQVAAQTQKPQLGPNELDPDELDDLWQANHMGITPKQRAAANANNPIISDERLKAAQDIWNSPQSED